MKLYISDTLLAAFSVSTTTLKSPMIKFTIVICNLQVTTASNLKTPLQAAAAALRKLNFKGNFNHGHP
jgi:hypothetical protein